MSVTSGGTALNPLSSGGRTSGSAGSAGISMTFLTFHQLAVRRLAMPEPDRCGEILQRDDDADESVGLGRIVCGTQLQHHLLLRAEIERLPMTAPAQVPDMQLVSILAGQQKLRIQSVLDHVRRAPLARDHACRSRGATRNRRRDTAVRGRFPSGRRTSKCLGIQHEHAAGAVAVRPIRARSRRCRRGRNASCAARCSPCVAITVCGSITLTSVGCARDRVSYR